MSPKKITVVDANGVERKVKLASQDGYDKLLRNVGVESLIDSEEYGIFDFASLDHDGRYTLGPPQQQKPMQAAMEKFFKQDATKLEIDKKDHITVERMEWFDVQLSRVYWRSCYSYILCSTIAFFENGQKRYMAATQWC